MNEDQLNCYKCNGKQYECKKYISLNNECLWYKVIETDKQKEQYQTFNISSLEDKLK